MPETPFAGKLMEAMAVAAAADLRSREKETTVFVSFLMGLEGGHGAKSNTQISNFKNNTEPSL